MVARVDRRPGNSRYFARFATAAVLLVGATLVLVLVVLPERYILSSGFVESGRSYPAARAPFAPLTGVRVGAQPREPVSFAGPPSFAVVTTPPPVVRGPAEIFWERVLPLTTGERYIDAIPLFVDYLARFPEDDNVRREYANTLIAGARPDQAIAELTTLLQRSDDPGLRLTLARTLRDQRRGPEAATQYALLSAAAPGDTALSLEWAQAHVWLEQYDDAERVLTDALSRTPQSVALRGQLAHVHYYSGKLREAEAILTRMSNAELAAANATTLLRDVQTALLPGPTTFVPTPPTLFERALTAREARDTTGARELFRAALAERSDDPATWLAYANFLEYDLGAFDEARAALIEAGRLQPLDAPTRLRLALLDSWTGRNADALTRLDALRTSIDTTGVRPVAADSIGPIITVSEIIAHMGDLTRWQGNMLGAAGYYRQALASDSANVRATEGLAAINADVARLIDVIESPRSGVHSYLLGDSDDFARLDIAGAWVGVSGPWVWNLEAGHRLLEGRNLNAALDNLDGLYAEFTPARWWRLGTVRTSVHAGLQRVRGETDVSFGAGIRWRGPRGTTVNLEARHEPAYQQSPTLQSVIADVEQTRLTAAYDAPLGRGWSAALQAEAARLAPEKLADAGTSTRFSGAATLARTMSSRWSVGLGSYALGYSDASPVTAGRRVYWDPATVVAVAPFARVQGSLAPRWESFLRVSPGVAFIDERGPGAEGSAMRGVPQLSAEGGIEYQGRRVRSALDVFYGQARADGYRSFGLRLTVSGASPLSDRPQR